MHLRHFPGVLAGLLAVAGRLVAAEEFTPLFNGRDLSGWVNVNCAPNTFTVRDGMIHCDGIPTGALRTVRPYENFILELEWRHLKPGGNAGVFVWSGPLPAVGQPFLRAIEVQVLDHAYGKSDWFTTHGDVFPIHGSSMKPFAPSRGERSFPRELRGKGSPEWNHYRIVATNGVLRLSVNGAEVSGGTHCHWRKGYLALESEGGEVDWRNLRIQELPSTGARPDESAPAAEPWRCLYDGRTLSGWTTSPEAEAAGIWKPSDWILRSAGTGRTDAVLWAPVELGDQEFFVDWKWSKAPGERVPPVVLQPATAGDRVVFPGLAAARPDGWNRLHLKRRGTGLELLLNDRPAGTVTVPAGRLVPGLQPGAAAVDFASPFWK
ncbi:MAG: DUF1080 domain-containing protein [Verrucomicrobiota bacterium]